MFRLPVSLRLAAPVFVLSAALAGCAQDTSRDSYVVFFDRDSVTLNPIAQAVIHKAAVAARAEHATHIQVAGSAGANGDPDVLKELATARAKAVAMRLQEEGIERAEVSQTTTPDTDIDSSHVALRRVSITINPK